MSQASTFGLPATGPATGAQVATRANDSLNALLSSHSGATEPDYKVRGTLWEDTASNTLKRWSGSVWQIVSESLADATILGRASGAGAGDRQQLTATQVRTILGLAVPSVFGANSVHADFSSNASYADYTTVDFVAAGLSIFAHGAAYIGQGSNTLNDMLFRLQLRDMTAGGLVAATGPVQVGTATAAAATGTVNLNPMLIFSGLTVGRTYRLVAQFQRTTTAGPNPITSHIGGINL